MVERPNRGVTEEYSRHRTEVRLAKNLKDAREFAERTGGSLTSKGGIPWTITYRGGDILWAGYPNKQPQVYEATPFLNNRNSGKHFNGFIGVDAVILTKDSATLISPGFGHDDTIFGCTFSNGRINEFETPVNEASKNQLKAREMARRESQRFMTHPTPKTVRIERA